MQAHMMDTPLSIPALLRRTGSLFGSREIVSRTGPGAVHRYTYRDCLARSRRLATALRSLGLQPGDRVATLCWNHHQHLEAYFGVPSAGLVLHTLNLRLPGDDLAWIVQHADDRALVVDEELFPLVEPALTRARVEHLIVVGRGGRNTLAYEALLDRTEPAPFPAEDIVDTAPAAMCYTSGTTGHPKGVVYSHRAIVVHALCSAVPDVFGLAEADTVLSVVPMFHANAWGLPYTAALVGARQVLAGPHPDSAVVAGLIEREQVTFTAGVPTVWLGLLQYLEARPGTTALASLRALVVGGAACPESLIREFRERHGVPVVHSWGMTEMTPVGTISHAHPGLAEAGLAETDRFRARQGRPIPFVELRARNEEGIVPWDGTAMGELEVRGPTVASAYYRPDEPGPFTTDGWFRTGDIATIDAHGSVEIRDRTKDLIKSGGEWISSVALETALMGHPAVAEAAVVAVPHPRWLERPLAAVVLKPGRSASRQDLLAFLGTRFPAWYLPDAIEFVESIPRTGTGKFRKAELRERYRDRLLGSA